MMDINAMAKRIAEANEFGALHIVVSDGNVDYGSIAFCLGLPDITDEERQLANDLLLMKESEREDAYELAEHWIRGFVP